MNLGGHNSAHNTWQDTNFSITVQKIFSQAQYQNFQIKNKPISYPDNPLQYQTSGNIWRGWLACLSSLHLALWKHYISVSLGQIFTQKLRYAHVFEIINFKGHSQYNSTFIKGSWNNHFLKYKRDVCICFPTAQHGLDKFSAVHSRTAHEGCVQAWAAGETAWSVGTLWAKLACFSLVFFHRITTSGVRAAPNEILSNSGSP